MSTHTHWKSLTNPNYLGSYAFENHQDMVCTIKVVRNEVVTGEGGRKEECTVCYFVENVKPMILNKTNMKTISKVAGSPFIEDWSGHKIQIYVDPKVRFGKEITGGLRIRPNVSFGVSNIKCESCGNEIKPAGSMNAEQTAHYTRQKYGKQLCAACATKLAQEGKQNVD